MADDRSRVERIVEEGVLIAVSAVRMAVKNRIIVGALRDHLDFDTAGYTEAAREEIATLVRQNRKSRRDAGRERSRLKFANADESSPEHRQLDIEQLKLRRRVYKLLGPRLEALAADDAQVAALVESARVDAGNEIRQAVEAKLDHPVLEPEPDYADRREERIATMLAFDYTALLEERMPEALE